MTHCGIHLCPETSSHRLLFQSGWISLCRNCTFDILKFSRNPSTKPGMVSWYRYLENLPLKSLIIEKLELIPIEDELYPLALGLTVFFDVHDPFFDEFLTVADFMAQEMGRGKERVFWSNRILHSLFSQEEPFDIIYSTLSHRSIVKEEGRGSYLERISQHEVTGYSLRSDVK